MMRLFIEHENPPDGSPSRMSEIAIDRTRPLGRGATATVYGVLTPAHASKVAKIYHDPGHFDGPRIKAMLAGAPPLKYANDGQHEVHPFAWPSHIVYDETRKKPVGYLMPRIGDANSLPLNFFFERRLATSKLPVNEQSLTARIKIARNLSALLAVLHSHKHHVIDFKPQNTKVFIDGLFVAILDCDSFSIQGGDGRRYPAPNYTSEYIAPEALRRQVAPRELKEAQDRFALAVVLFQLLNNGIHPFQGILKTDAELPTTDDRVRGGYYPYGTIASASVGPCIQSIHECFDDKLRAMFDRAFAGPPRDRPSAAEWSAYFKTVLNDRLLQRCNVHANDPTHIRFEGKGCGLCHFDGVLRKSRPVLTLAPTTSASNGQRQCGKCGKSAPATLMVCPSCGARDFRTPRTTPSPSPTPVPAQKPSTAWKVVVLGVIAAIIAYALFFSQAPPKPTPTPQPPYTPTAPTGPTNSATPPPATNTVTPNPLPSSQDWRAEYDTASQGTIIRCVAYTTPKLTDDGAADRRRQLMVSLRPGSGTYWVGIFAPYASGVSELEIGNGARFMFAGQDGRATPTDSTNILPIIGLFRGYRVAWMRGPSRQGGMTKDEYSLMGFTDAYTAAASKCRMTAFPAP